MWSVIYDNNRYKIYENDSVEFKFKLYMFEYSNNSRSYLRYSKDNQYIGIAIRTYERI
jgi:hypothetical protein